VITEYSADIRRTAHGVDSSRNEEGFADVFKPCDCYCRSPLQVARISCDVFGKEKPDGAKRIFEDSWEKSGEVLARSLKEGKVESW
jgi:hypothetical protein